MAMAKKQGFSSSAPAPSPSSEWPDRAVSILLKTYAQKFSVDRGYLRTQDWQEVAFAVNSVCDPVKTLKQCRDKVDSLKRRYKIEKRKAVNGGEVSWPFFHRLDDIMNSVLKQGNMHSHPNASSGHVSADADGGDDVDVDNIDEVVEFQHEILGEEEGGGIGAAHRQERCDDDVGADVNGNHGTEDKDGLNSYDSPSASSDIPPFLKNDKPAVPHDDNDMSQEEDNSLNGGTYWHLHRPFQDRSYRLYQQHQQDGFRPHCRQGRQYQHNQQDAFRPHYRRQPEQDFHDYFLQTKFRGPSKPSTFSGGTQESTENRTQEEVKRPFIRTHKRKFESDNGIDALANAVTGLSKPLSAASFLDMFTRIERVKVEILKKVRLEFTQLDSKRQKRSSTSRKPHRSMSTTSH